MFETETFGPFFGQSCSHWGSMAPLPSPSGYRPGIALRTIKKLHYKNNESMQKEVRGKIKIC